MNLQLLVERFAEASGLTEAKAWAALGASGLLDAAADLAKVQAGAEKRERRLEADRERKRRSRSGVGASVAEDAKPVEKKTRSRVVYQTTRPAITAEFYDSLLSTLSGQGLTPKLLDDILDESEAVFQSRKTSRTLSGLRKWTVHFVTNKISKLRGTYGKN